MRVYIKYIATILIIAMIVIFAFVVLNRDNIMFIRSLKKKDIIEEKQEQTEEVLYVETDEVNNETKDMLTVEEKKIAVDETISSIEIGDYIVSLEDNIEYDGSALLCYYNVEQKDGMEMPSEQEYTKDKLGGEIVVHGLFVDDVHADSCQDQFDFFDTYIIRQKCEFEFLERIESSSNTAECVLILDYYPYENGECLGEQQFEIPFTVEVNSDIQAKEATLENSKIPIDDFIVEIMPFDISEITTSIEVRLYKKGSDTFAKNMEEYILIDLKDEDGKRISCESERGVYKDEDGDDYIEYKFYVGSDYDLNKGFFITFYDNIYETIFVNVN